MQHRQAERLIKQEQHSTNPFRDLKRKSRSKILRDWSACISPTQQKSSRKKPAQTQADVLGQISANTQRGNKTAKKMETLRKEAQEKIELYDRLIAQYAPNDDEAGQTD